MTRPKMTAIACSLTSAALLLAFASASGNSTPNAPRSRDLDSDRSCKLVSGMLMTNFGAIDANTTMGVATGDLGGAVSGTLLGAPQPGPGGTLVFLVQHHWVTDSGDTLFFDKATATTLPISQTLFAVVTYPVHLTGGTGKFAGATGDFTSIGEVDLVNGTVFRYHGRVCFAEPDGH